MAKTKRSTTAKESDSAYFLKMVLFLVVGSQWVFITNQERTSQVPIPIGLIVGLVFTAHEHFKMDRKIEYALLLVATMLGLLSNVGIYITTLK